MKTSSFQASALAVVGAVCTTLCAGLALTVGVQLLVRRHNGRRSLRLVRRRRAQVSAQLRAAEAGVRTLGPQLSALAGDLRREYAAAAPRDKARLVRRLKEVDERLTSALEALDAVRPADLAAGLALPRDPAPDPAPAATPAPAPDLELAAAAPTAADDAQTLVDNGAPPKRSASVTSSHSHLSEAETLQGSPNLSLSLEAAAAADEKQVLSDEQKPNQPASDSATRTPTATTTTTTTFQAIAKLLPPFAFSSITTTASSFFSAYPSSLFISTEELSPENVAAIQTSISQCRARKRNLVQKIQQMASTVDGLFESVIVNVGGNAQ